MQPTPIFLLFRAIRRGQLDRLTSLLDDGVSVESTWDFVGDTPLTYAALHDRVAIATLLLDRGADIDRINGRSLRPLIAAAARGYLDMLTLLVSRGAQLELGGPDGCTAVQVALQNQRHEVVTWLLDHGARARFHTPGQVYTLLPSAVYYGYPGIPQLLNHPDVVDAVDLPGLDGIPALHKAVFHRRVDCMLQLLDAGVADNATDIHGRTALHIACACLFVNEARALLRRATRATVNARDGSDLTPLQIAAGAQSSISSSRPHLAAPLVRLLLRHGANRATLAPNGMSARDFALEARLPDVVHVLDTYFPVALQMEQTVLGLRSATPSPLTRFAGHYLFEPKVLSLVKCFLTGDQDGAFSQLLEDGVS